VTELLDPRLADCRRIFLHEFSLELSIGFHDFEREAPQRVIIDVDLFVPMAHSTAINDEVSEVLDYDFIRRGVIGWARSRHFNLQETLVDGIVALCFEQPSVRAVRVRTQKPEVYPDCRAVGIEVMQFRPGV
jgi:dihydroneopterin aldolase